MKQIDSLKLASLKGILIASAILFCSCGKDKDTIQSLEAYYNSGAAQENVSDAGSKAAIISLKNYTFMLDASRAVHVDTKVLEGGGNDGVSVFVYEGAGTRLGLWAAVCGILKFEGISIRVSAVSNRPYTVIVRTRVGTTYGYFKVPEITLDFPQVFKIPGSDVIIQIGIS